MEKPKQQFINDTVKFASKWYGEKAKEYVTKYPEVTLRLSKEKLAGMKAQVTCIARNAAKPVEAALSDPGVWWRLEPGLHVTSQYEQLGNDAAATSSRRKLTTPSGVGLAHLGMFWSSSGLP